MEGFFAAKLMQQYYHPPSKIESRDRLIKRFAAHRRCEEGRIGALT